MQTNTYTDRCPQSFQVRIGTAVFCMESTRSLCNPTVTSVPYCQDHAVLSRISHFFSLNLFLTYLSHFLQPALIVLSPQPPLILKQLSFCGLDPWSSESRPSAVAHFPAKASYSINIQAVEIDWWEIKWIENLSEKSFCFHQSVSH